MTPASEAVIRVGADRLARYLPGAALTLPPGELVCFSGAALFADISGFTAMSERFGSRGRKGVDHILQRVRLGLTTLADPIVKRGQLITFEGDAATGVFKTIDDAVAAAEEQVEEVGRRLDDLTVHIGVAEGPIVQAVVGNERRGRIEIIYSSGEELERLAEMITPRRG